ncbi:Mad3/BUB1 homology region 1-domain-containing protein [Aspergillus ambiguus]|uniref:putative checkpoint protein kinase (SldA) n=1 Tax=Aspergillus ambiguus TaxID=176160 RepID=UPI003CCDBA0C
MAANEDLVNFDIIETQKENIQSLPGGRSARELARIFSPKNPKDILATPSPNDTRTLNDAIKQEYETELQAIGESDDPLDIYDRYVKWTLNAYPSTQATPESGLLPLLERAVRSFLSSPHYKNDPRYLRLWLHYIRLFSDSPRETFAFLARHHIGEGLALFYEEFAAWLEGAGRWTQADEVYRLGLDREARPAERLVRKYSEFQQRYERHSQDAGPSSPALPVVRPALAAKVDPFAGATTDAQTQQSGSSTGPPPKTKSGKPKMAIFSDADSAESQPAVSGQSKGWDNVGSLHERRKENKVEAKPWVGETLKAGKKPAPVQKMAIFRDEVSPRVRPLLFNLPYIYDHRTNWWHKPGLVYDSCIQSTSNSNVQEKESTQPQQVPEHRVREAINPRTGRRERVFVNLDAVYPDYSNPAHEVSFEELRAISRGWMQKNWRLPKEPLKQISGNENAIEHAMEEKLPREFKQKLTVKEADGSDPQAASSDGLEGKSGKVKKLKLREVRGETQTVKMKFDSPTGGKIRRKSTAEPTMTMHTRAATDEIYSIFNQPLKAETENAESSDFDDDDYTSAGESTVTGHLSAPSSDFGDDETTTFHKGFDDNTRAESVVDGEWTQFTEGDVSRLEPSDSQGEITQSTVFQEADDETETHDQFPTTEKHQRQRFIPEMPDDYNPPCGPYRDPAVVAQNRLPFMTPIVEQTEHSLASMTAARSALYNAKTPSKPAQGNRTPQIPQMGNLLGSPLMAKTPYAPDNTVSLPEDVAFSPTAKKAAANPRFASPLPDDYSYGPIIKDSQCNPTDREIRRTILEAAGSDLTSLPGYRDHSGVDTQYAQDIHKFMKIYAKRARSGGEDAFDIPMLDLPGAERSYIIRRELGAGAYAPVYLAESPDNSTFDSEIGSTDGRSKGSSPVEDRMTHHQSPRYGFEAIKIEVGPPSPWEFYMIQKAHERLNRNSELSRVTESIIRAHELHVFKNETVLVEDYRGQGTLLDLINLVRNEPSMANNNGEGGVDEVLAMFFTVELFRTVEALHACGILHGDLKADNCLVRFDNKPTTSSFIPSEESLDSREIYYSPHGSHGWHNKGLCLIDFGRAVDMQAFEPTVQFIADWEITKHECNEIQEMRPWTHQIDLFGLAGIVHVMLFGKYIESSPVRRSECAADGMIGASCTKTYRIRETLKRYWEREIWSDVFDLLLNPGADRWVQMERKGNNPAMALLDENANSPTALPVLNSMRYVREKMEAWLLANAEKKGLGLQIRKLEAILSDKKRKLGKH